MSQMLRVYVESPASCYTTEAQYHPECPPPCTSPDASSRKSLVNVGTNTATSNSKITARIKMKPSLAGIELDLLEQDALRSYARRERERHAGLVPGLSLC